MTREESERFVSCFGFIGEKCGWDIRGIVGEYQDLPLDEAISAFTRDVARFCKNSETDKPDLPERMIGNTQGSKTLYLPYQASEYLS